MIYHEDFTPSGNFEGCEPLKVVCTGPDSKLVEVGKTYTATNISDSSIRILFDDGNWMWLHPSWFVTLTEYRSTRIKEILK